MALSVVFFFIWENRKTTKAKSESEKIIAEAERKRENILNSTRKESNEIIKKSEKIEERILEREGKIEQKLEQIEQKYDKIAQKENDIKEEKEKIFDKQHELDGKLEEMSKLTEKEARELFLEQIKNKYQDDGLEVVKKFKKKTEDSKKEVAREIILKSIQQYAGDVTSEVTTTVIEIPSDDIKGKLIGKE
jgi:ribonuclease Y